MNSKLHATSGLLARRPLPRGLVAIALALPLMAAGMWTLAQGQTAKPGMQMQMPAKEKDEHGMAAACERGLEITDEAERQMGGAMFAGAMPKGSGGTMAMGGQQSTMAMGNMAGQAQPAAQMGASQSGSQMPGMDMAHQDHDAKEGGVLFMAPNEIHHIEGVYSKDCGFQLYLYNAFTKPIHVERFRAFINVLGVMNGRDVELVRFLEADEHGVVLQAAIPKEMEGEFEIELNVKFPEGDAVEVFNYAVDEHGELS